MTCRYDMLAIDLDGTLLGPGGRVSAANRRAVADARAAGLRVVVCTGRGLVECAEILKGIGQDDPVVVAGGSIVGCPVTKKTLHRFALAPAVVEAATARLLAHAHPVMVLKDSCACGYDYLMVVGEEKLSLDPVTEWWLRKMRVEHRFAAGLHEDEHPEHTVRLGVCGLSGALEGMVRDLREDFGDVAAMHHFPAVVASEHARVRPDGQRLHILEVFAASANKWSGISWLAAARAVPRARIAAIGDEINDVPMIAGAGLGIAMGNAVPAVRAVAGRVTGSNADDGVATAIYRVLAGEW